MWKRLVQAKLVSKVRIGDLIEKTDFDDKLKKLNAKFTSSKIKHVPLQSELNSLSEKIKAISTKGLTKYVKNYYSTLNGRKYCWK